LYQALSIPEVITAVPLYLKYDRWQNPKTKQKRNILIIGYKINDRPFKLPEVYRYKEKVQIPFTVLIDRLSLPIIGPKDIGLFTEINHRKIEVVGHFSLGVGFVADGAVIVTDQNFLRLFKDIPLDYANLGLVTLDKEANLKDVKETLNNILPPDVKILTRIEIETEEFSYWREVTATGPIFGAGVIVAFIVGMVVLYQVLSNEISNNLPEYATLKAIGYENKYLSRIVLQQGLFLAILGYLLSFGLSFELYDITRKATNLPIYMTLTRSLFVFGLTVLMCSFSGFLSLKRVKKADPADLF
jgi:putative ABC transport system permease protein